MIEKILNETLEVMRKQGEDSIYIFAKHFMPHHLESLPSKAHHVIYKKLQAISRDRNCKYAIAAPRDFGKSTLVTLIYVIWSICYEKEKFIVILSNTSGQARQTLDNIRRELTQNERLRLAFTHIFEADGNPKPPRWQRHDIITRNNIEILALGSGQQIRGMRHGASRPTLIILDDFESSNSSYSHESREKMKDILTRSVLKAGSESTNVLFIGNLYHPHCLLSEYTNPELNPGWMSEVLKAIIKWPVKSDLWEKWRNIYNGREKYENICGPKAALKYYQANKQAMDEGAVLLWPERQSLYSLTVAYQENELAFMSEMQNSPRDAKDCIFNTDDIQYWTDRYPSVEDLLHALGNNAEYYGACDPSLGSQNLKGDYSAIICLIRDKRDGVLYVIEADLKRRTPDETIEDILAYYKRYQFIKFGLEINQFQKLMLTRLEEKGRKAGLYISLEQFNNTVDKIKRIQNLQPLVKNGTIKFSRHHRLFLDEVRDFPRSAHDDGLDCAEMAVRTAEEPGKVQVFICGGGSLYDDFDDNDSWKNCFK